VNAQLHSGQTTGKQKLKAIVVTLFGYTLWKNYFQGCGKSSIESVLQLLTYGSGKYN